MDDDEDDHTPSFNKEPDTIDTCDILNNENTIGSTDGDTGFTLNNGVVDSAHGASLFSTDNTSADSNMNITDGISNLHLFEFQSADNENQVDSTCEKTNPCLVGNRKVCWEDVVQYSYKTDAKCACETGDDVDAAICPGCFLLQTVEQSLCFDKVVPHRSAYCHNHLFEENELLENICKCEKKDVDKSACGNCILDQNNVSPGSKRKPQEACCGLHMQMNCCGLRMQMNQSKELLEESANWLSNTHSLFKKPKIPPDRYETLLEPILTDPIDIMPFTIPSHDCSDDDELEINKIENDVFTDAQLIDLDGEELLNEIGTMPEQTTRTCIYSFDSLPTELKLKIFSYFTQRELCRYIAPICASWFDLSKDISFWQHLDVSQDYDDVSNDLLVRVIVSWCKHITKLELNKRHDITITEFREIFQNCPNIKNLSVAFCTQIDDDILRLVGTYCKCLKSINLEGCSNTNDNSFYSFVGLPLTSVNVSYCNMIGDDGGIFLVRNFKNLVEINFDGIQWMSEDFVKMLVNMHYETLEKVILDGENLGDDAVRQLSRCKKLRALSFSFCTLMTHHAIEWVGQCVQINHLQLRKGSSFTNASLLSYLKNMSVNQGLQYKYLNLSECSEISDKCLFYLSERCPNLETLDLSWCWEVSDDGLEHIIDNCHKLKELFLRGLHELYGTPFFRLSRSVPHLKTLDLHQCNKVEDTLIHHLVEKMKDLIIHNYYGEVVMNTRHRDAHRHIDKC